MPFIKTTDRKAIDSWLDPLIININREPDGNKQKAMMSYIMYKLLLSGGGDRIAKMFRAYGALEATRLNLDQYFAHVDQAIMIERWIDGNAAR